MNKQAFLYLLKNNEPSYKLEIDPGLRCFLEDLSDTGCAVVVAGKTENGLRVKVQFALDNIPICISGVVRSNSFKEDTNRSTLRIEADPMPMEIRNHILGQMFGMSPEDDDDLPFRVIEDEAAKSHSIAGTANNNPFPSAAQEKPSADSALNDIKMEDLF